MVQLLSLGTLPLGVSAHGLNFVVSSSVVVVVSSVEAGGGVGSVAVAVFSSINWHVC